MKKIFYYLYIFILLFYKFASSDNSQRTGLKTNEPVYQNPFDLSAGGASLTKATQEGVLFTNPSLASFGNGFLRWIFFRTALHLGADSVDLAKALYDKTVPIDLNLIDKILKTPVHLGLDMAGGTILSNFGFGAFMSIKIDISGRQYGSIGLPEIRNKLMGYGGLIISSSIKINDFWTIGGATRYQASAELIKTFSLLDLNESQQFINNIKQSLNYGYGLGVDIASTFQLRTKYIDFRLATTINDIGDTKFTKQMPTWKETFNIGSGFTIHNKDNAVHCAYDIRDILQKYQEHWTKRSYMGCKAIFNNIIGIGTGLYQGWPTYGFILNLYLIRIEAGSYTKEFGTEINTEGRRIYFIAIGAEFP